MLINSDKCRITLDSTVAKGSVVFKALAYASIFLHFERPSVIEYSLNNSYQWPPTHFDELNAFPTAEDEKMYKWLISAYSVFWAERPAGRSYF